MQNPLKRASGGFGVPGGSNPQSLEGHPRGYHNTESSPGFGQRTQTFDVYVGRIPQEWTEEKLWEIFLPFGEIKSVQIINNPEFRNDRKIGFVRFLREDAARKSVEAHSLTAGGNTYRLQVNMAQRGKNKERSPNNTDYNQGKRSYSDYKKGGTYDGQQGNERGYSSGNNDNRQGKPRQRMFDTDYAGGYSCNNPSNFMQKNTSTPVQSYPRNSPDQSRGLQTGQKNRLNHSAGLQKQIVLREEVLLVTEVESPVMFWGQVGIPSVARNLAQSSEDLQTYCPTGPKVGKAAQKNKVYSGIYPLDNLWYRCTVLEFLQKGKVKVKYIDYGNVEIIDQEGLVELPSSLSDPPPFVHLYQLADCIAFTDPASAVMTNPLALEQLRNLINGKLVTVKVVSEDPRGIRGVYVDHPGDPGKTINDVMIAGGCVRRIKRSDGGIIERSVAEKPLNGDLRETGESNKKTVKQDNDNLRRTIKFQSETICNLNKLYESVKQQNAELNQELNQAFNHKVKSVLATVGNLNQIRDNSLLCDKRTKIIDEGILLVTDSTDRLTLENVDTFSQVCFASDALRLAQDSIRSCEDKEQLTDIVEHRNKVRQELLDHIKDFLHEVSSLDLDNRENKLKTALQDLNVLYQPVGGKEEPPLTQAIDEYKEWKTNLQNQMDGVRNETEIASSRFAGEFAKLQKLLDPTEKFGLDDCGQVDLDSIFVQFDEAVVNERKQVQVAENKESAEVTSLLIGSLMNEIQHELSDIAQLRTSAAEYTEIQEYLESEANKEPDVSKLLDVRKNLKTIKSKFRHKQADRKDLEEGDELNASEDLKKVEEDIVELRSQLHQLLSEEKAALEELANLAANHFPEIPLQYVEFGLEKFMTSNGLVKQGWELTYFSHNEMKKVTTTNNNHVAFLTTFNGNPCALKEYNLENIADITVFESRAVAYSKVSDPNLLQLQALFYDKTSRKAFIHVPYYETNLKTWLATNPAYKSKRNVIRDICKALNSLHQDSLTHGSVVMDNIYVDSNMRGILGEYCFANDVQERVALSAEALLKNAVPIACDSSPAFDMYCLGEITCQVFLGDVPVVRDLNSLQKHTQDKNLLSMLELMLALNGGRRPTAFQVLSHPFFVDDTLFETQQPEEDSSVGKDKPEEKKNEAPEQEEKETEAKEEREEAEEKEDVVEIEIKDSTTQEEKRVEIQEDPSQEDYEPVQEESEQVQTPNEHTQEGGREEAEEKEDVVENEKDDSTTQEDEPVEIQEDPPLEDTELDRKESEQVQTLNEHTQEGGREEAEEKEDVVENERNDSTTQEDEPVGIQEDPPLEDTEPVRKESEPVQTLNEHTQGGTFPGQSPQVDDEKPAEVVQEEKPATGTQEKPAQEQKPDTEAQENPAVESTPVEQKQQQECVEVQKPSATQENHSEATMDKVHDPESNGQAERSNNDPLTPDQMDVPAAVPSPGEPSKEIEKDKC